MTLEEAAEKVFAPFHVNISDMDDPFTVKAVHDALRACREQWRIEGATAMREMAAKVASNPNLSTKASVRAIRALDPNQLKDTDHG